MCHAIVNQKLPHLTLFKNGLSESTEGVEANLAATRMRSKYPERQQKSIGLGMIRVEK